MNSTTPMTACMTGRPQQSACQFVGADRPGQGDQDVALALASTRHVTLVGSGGIGKTRLAIEVARSLLARFPDGVYLVSLASAVDANSVLAMFATSVGVNPASRPAYARACQQGTRRAARVVHTRQLRTCAWPRRRTGRNAIERESGHARSRDQPGAAACRGRTPVLGGVVGRARAATIRARMYCNAAPCSCSCHAPARSTRVFRPMKEASI